MGVMRGLSLATVGGLLVTAGVLKAADPLPAARVLASLAPGLLRDAPDVAIGLAGVVAAAEVGLGLALVARHGSRATVALCAGLVGVFTLVLVLLWARGDAPGCGCFGTGRLWSGRAELAAGMVRNLGLLALLAGACPRGPSGAGVTPSRAVVPSGAGSASGGSGSAAGARAFTLVEVLVVMLVLGVVAAMVLPSLAGSREAARSARRAGVAAGLLAGLDSYARDARDQFPFFGRAGRPLDPLVIDGTPMPWSFFRAHRWFWASAIVPRHLDVDRAAIEDPGRAEHMRGALGWSPSIIAADFQASSTLFARPGFWGPAFDQAGPLAAAALVAPTTPYMVAQPARKGLIFNDLGGPTGAPVGPGMTVGMGDGSVRTTAWRTLDPARAVERPWGAAGLPIESTLEGLAGVDF